MKSQRIRHRLGLTTLSLTVSGFIAGTIAGCGGGSGGTAPPPPAAMQQTRVLNPMRDPWPSTLPRWWDIADRPFNAFLTGTQTFTYNGAQLTLTYDTNPSVPYFVGHVEARGLKPNFAYQLKLAGKPTKGSRGWGAGGDDFANERIGMAGRWWCDSQHASQTNFNDQHYLDFYKNAPGNGNPVHNIYGYLYMGVFVTDENGDASLDFNGSHSYHVTWKDTQGGFKDVVAGTWSIGSTSAYGYGTTVAPQSVKLWYEYESSRPHNVILPKGTYNCRLLITEESFHNSTSTPNGGFWQTVLATEDHDGAGQADTNPANDITFTIN